MKHVICSLFLAFLLNTTTMAMAGKVNKCNINIGVTLPPHYSWVSNIAGNTIKITTLTPENSEAYSYLPRAKDLTDLQHLDALLINLQGHDGYIRSILNTIGRKELKLIDINAGNAQDFHNSPTHIAITDAIPQIQAIAGHLGELCPDNKIRYKRNARAYARRLQRMLQAALNKIKSYDTSNLRIATVNEDYAYLMRELGLETVAVIQARHSVEPSSSQLRSMIKRIKIANANILLTDFDYKKKHADIISQVTGCRIYSLPHLSHSKYTADRFEVDIQKYIDNIIEAVEDASRNS